MMRIGVASIMQETNTWSPVPCTLEDFLVQDLAIGAAVAARYGTTATEVGGALRTIEDEGLTAVPLLRAWANSSGRLTRDTFDHLRALLVEQVSSTPLDGLVLPLHGAMAADGIDDADTALVHAAREVLGPEVPIAVTFDLHANVTQDLLRVADIVTGYHTYPHTDLAETGARAVRLLAARLRGTLAPVVAVAKRPMVIPAESMGTAEGPLGELRRDADALTMDGVLDISLFPVQPWLDVEDLGFGVTVVTDGDPELASTLAESFAERAWSMRNAFAVTVRSPSDAIAQARASHVRPFLITESADAPTAGAAGDSPVMVRALLAEGQGLRSYVTVADGPAVARCFDAGEGASVDLLVGCSVDKRFHEPAPLSGVVERIGDEPVVLRGPSYTGMTYSCGRFAVVRSGTLRVLLTERPAFTLDPVSYEHAGLALKDADVIVVRSALGFRAAFPPESVAHAVVLDVDGASTPRLDLLRFERAPRPLYPLDREQVVSG